MVHVDMAVVIVFGDRNVLVRIALKVIAFSWIHFVAFSLIVG